MDESAIQKVQWNIFHRAFDILLTSSVLSVWKVASLLSQHWEELRPPTKHKESTILEIATSSSKPVFWVLRE